MKITLRFNDIERSEEFDRSEIIVGRPNPYIPPDLDLAPDITVSRTHARIYERDGWFWIEDLASKYGTLVNGVKQEVKRRLNPDDAIRIGETDLKVVYPPGFKREEPVPARARKPESPPKTLPAAIPPPLPPEWDKPAVEETGSIRVDTELSLADTSLLQVAENPGFTRQRLGLLLELPMQFATKQDIPSVLQHTVDSLVRALRGADRGAAVLRNLDNNRLDIAAWSGSEQPAVSSSLCFKAMSEGRALIWRRTVDGVSSESMQRLEIKTGMYAPMIWQDRALGALCVDNPTRDCLFTDEELQFLVAVANYAAMAVANFRLSEGP